MSYDRQDYALLEEVRSSPWGSVLAAAASVSDTELVVENGSEFDAVEGGILDLNGARLAYTTVVDGDLPDDPDTIVLAEPLTAAADAEDTVAVVIGGQIAEDFDAYVTMGEGDQIIVPLTVDQRSQWPRGVYDPPVPVVVSDDMRRIEDAPGRTPLGRVGFRNTDSASAATDDVDVIVSLGHVPLDGSLHVRQNGLDLQPSEWSLSGQQVTIAPAVETVIRSGDLFTAAYAYDPDAAAIVSPPAIIPTWRDTAPQNLNGFLIPDDAQVGDFLVAVAMMPTTESVTALNGFELVGVSEYVTHSAIGGLRTYRLEVYSGINDGISVPTVSTIAPQDVVCAMSAFENGAAASGTFDTLDDGTSADAPAMDPVSLRVWGTIGDTVSITPGRGVTVLSTDYVEIDIAMTIDDDPTPAPATSSGDAGWCLASLAVTA